METATTEAPKRGRKPSGESKTPKRPGITLRPISTSVLEDLKNIAVAFSEKEPLVIAAGIYCLTQLNTEDQLKVLTAAKLKHVNAVKAEQSATSAVA